MLAEVGLRVAYEVFEQFTKSSGEPALGQYPRKETTRLVHVTWDAPTGEVYPVDFEVVGIDRLGLLMNVLDVIAGMNKSASRVAADVQGSANARIHFRIDVKDQTEVNRVKDAVLRIDDVTRTYRARPGLKA